MDVGISSPNHYKSCVFIFIFDLISFCFLGRPTLIYFRPALALWCLTKKFPTENNIGVVKGDQEMAREYYMTELREAK